MSEEEDFICERVIKCKNLTIIPITKLRLIKKNWICLTIFYDLNNLFNWIYSCFNCILKKMSSIQRFGFIHENFKYTGT